MFWTRLIRAFRKPRFTQKEIFPDEIFLDSSNLPEFDVHQFEGRIERPISIFSIIALSSVFMFVTMFMLGRAWILQAQEGETYARMSEANRLDQTLLFAERGAIYDRNGVKLAWNTLSPDEPDFAVRAYTEKPGFGHLLGYIKYPAKDKYGVYYRTEFEPKAGIELYYDEILRGEHGIKIVETDALGNVTSESSVRPTEDGKSVTLSVDARVQEKLYGSIKELADRVGFSGGGGAIMDIRTGEVLALTSYPEYRSSVMSDGTDAKTINGYLTDKDNPFLNRVLDGLYTPGSIVKPYVALAALEEKVIDPEKVIVSTGTLLIPNPYDPTKNTAFNDWKAHGPVDMRKALAVSSNVYFYQIGGGFEDQEGLGIGRIEKYLSIFEIGESNEGGFFAGPQGTIPSPDWKEEKFPGDPWRIGDTYYTAIGQYGFQVTPLQMVKAASSLASGGTIAHPTILSLASSTERARLTSLALDQENIQVVRDGMRQAVLTGTASGLNVPFVEVAAKTGTAELGVSKQFVNSWVTGFFPYGDPRYAFVVFMERGPRANIYGATFVMRELLDWMNIYAQEYLQPENRGE